ncbi:PKD-like family lipoprotein [Pedobacter africanus]|uniref:PKD-like family protein n=1 Tax=Pedobacter africanus TaxID=151894 RepID=A0A1W2DXL7_9SPHI|nr:PKD-like family lipoprotein [Pedobacter africanus]SMD02224.1 PKD-like family protein [Pedobacter africanus]
MKRCNIILLVLAVFFLSACSKDLGTDQADYRDINEVTIEGIDKNYARDMDDSLKIEPKVTGTIYSDTSKFNYSWDISNTIVSTSLNLKIRVDMVPGNKISRFIVEDKVTKVKKYFRFDLNVSSSTAGNLIMVLSKSNGKAELSYLRLDKTANWAINYYESRFGSPLGINPERLDMLMVEPTGTALAAIEPFANRYGRVMVLADNKIALIDKGSLERNVVPYLEGTAFTGTASYPPPNIEGYKPEFMAQGIALWRNNPYGSNFHQNVEFQLISGGALYFATLAPPPFSSSFAYNRKSVYGQTGYFSAFGYYDTMLPTPNGTLFQHGYTLGNFIVFDRVFGRFAYSSYGTSYNIPTTDVKAFPGHELVYGSATSQSGTSFAVLKTSANALRFLLLGKVGNKYSLSGEVAGGVASDKSKFYNLKTSPYLFFTSGNKLYKYNILDITSNSVPNESHAVLSLTSLGYSADAVITSMTVSRTEKSLILGVSRYGTDTNGNGQENKGDVLVFSLDKAGLGLTLKEKYVGVSGIPVDVKIKYQTHWRDGKANGGVIELDNI